MLVVRKEPVAAADYETTTNLLVMQTAKEIKIVIVMNVPVGLDHVFRADEKSSEIIDFEIAGNLLIVDDNPATFTLDLQVEQVVSVAKVYSLA